MSDKNTKVPNLEPLRTVTDDQIVTERKLPRRSFLSTTGALLTGAAGIVAGMRGSSLQDQTQDPDKKPADPDKKPADPDKPSDDERKRREEERRKRREDSDKKPSDPDKRPADPNKPTDPQRTTF